MAFIFKMIANILVFLYGQHKLKGQFIQPQSSIWLVTAFYGMLKQNSHTILDKN